MTYDGRAHTRLATLPGMWERTLTVTSAGKTFSVTGWKIGACSLAPARCTHRGLGSYCTPGF
jgi:N-succinyldiaminopimelate aminotransferase